MRTLLTLLFLSSVAQATQVFVGPPPGDLPSGLSAATLRSLVVSSVTSLGAEVTSDPAAAEYELRPGCLQLGTAYLVSVERIEKSGKHGDIRKAKAREIEELDEVVHRVVRAAMASRTVSSDARPDDVTIDETTQGTRRKPNRSGSVVAVGPAVLDKFSTPGMLFYFSFGHGWGIGPVTLGWRWDFAIRPSGEAGLFTDLNFNATYYFLDHDTSPFVTGEFGFGLGRNGSKASTYTGIMAGGTGGVALFRTYGKHLEIGLQIASIFAAGAPSNPLLGALRIGASF